ncbi:hypothetical protein [Paenibacillus marinisediminis]
MENKIIKFKVSSLDGTEYIEHKPILTDELSLSLFTILNNASWVDGNLAIERQADYKVESTNTAPSVVYMIWISSDSRSIDVMYDAQQQHGSIRQDDIKQLIDILKIKPF